MGSSGSPRDISEGISAGMGLGDRLGTDVIPGAWHLRDISGGIRVGMGLGGCMEIGAVNPGVWYLGGQNKGLVSGSGRGGGACLACGGWATVRDHLG